MKQTIPPRLHVIFARQASTAIVIRRGPSRWCATFGWDRVTDSFKLGQWLKGRIFERRCDLSPDGKLLIYFAMKGFWEQGSRGSWTAISRMPYLKAIGFWPVGEVNEGGGLFNTNSTFWLNGEHVHEGMRFPEGLRMTHQSPDADNWGGGCPAVYYPHLVRAGWKLTAKSCSDLEGKYTRCRRFEKSLPNGWTLVKFAREWMYDSPVKGSYFDQHLLVRNGRSVNVDGAGWSWCDWDAARRRVCWATGGCIHAARLGEGGLIEEKLVHDFNSYEFEAVAAPY